MPAAPAQPRLSIEALQDQLGPAMWRGDHLAGSGEPTLPTGHAALDRELPGGGWPSRSLTEVLITPGAACEWRLLGPGLPAWLHPGRVLVLVGAPAVPRLQPFAAGLQATGLDSRQLLWLRELAPTEALWAAEQALHCRDSAAVLAWLPVARPEALRRLHAHAQLAQVPLFVFRPARAQQQASAAPLRLRVEPATSPCTLSVRLLKRRGPSRPDPIELPALPPGLAPVVAVKLRAALSRRMPPVVAAVGPAGGASPPAHSPAPSREVSSDAVLVGPRLPAVSEPA
ncbi:RecA/RadA recombinase [Caldimonas brevitalea]|uniref:RecA/RadA recombinase n=1 Tax=Caldimonas brevitalea TaxID=413882 RepID=A0A0G3BEW9_9BURK|nr:RecA/RadA recombinase [Caldimonas brevitalea]